MKRSQLFPILGFCLGWGAPCGALALRYAGSFSIPLYEFIGREWAQNSFFYWYMIAGTCSVLTAAGYFLGRMEDLMSAPGKGKS